MIIYHNFIGGFMESYRQVCHNKVEITNELLKTVEEQLKDNSLSKELKFTNLVQLICRNWSNCNDGSAVVLLGNLRHADAHLAV